MAPPDHPPAHRARLYLVSPKVLEPGAFVREVAAVAAGTDVASLLLSLESDDEGVWREAAAALLPVCQAQEIALLLDGHPRLASEQGADGAHIRTGGRDLRAALALLKPDSIVGAGGFSTRHDAMVAGEAGADYVAFGEPHKAPHETLEERVAWWAEVFEVPCVAFVDDLERAARLSRAGADFVALGAGVWDAPEGPASAVARLERMLDAAENEVRA